MSESFDELSRSVAQGVPRRRLLRMAGVAVAGAAAATVMRPVKAEASCPVSCDKGGPHCGPGANGCCEPGWACSDPANICCCPKGTTPCGTSCCNAGVACLNRSTGLCGCQKGTTPCGSG